MKFKLAFLVSLIGSSLYGQDPQIVTTYRNDAVTGTIQAGLVSVSATNRVIATTAGSTDGVIGICHLACGIDGAVDIAVAGVEPLNIDNATTAGDWIQIGSTGWKGHDTGSKTRPTSGQVIGVAVTTNAVAGTYPVQLQLSGSGGGGGGAPSGPAGAFPSLNGSNGWNVDGVNAHQYFTNIPDPSALTVAPTCAGTCATSYGYVVVEFNGVGWTLASAETDVSNAATLDSSHFNTITYPIVSDANVTCTLVRSSGPASPQEITGLPNSGGGFHACDGSTFVDNTPGSAQAVTLPSANTTQGALLGQATGSAPNSGNFFGVGSPVTMLVGTNPGNSAGVAIMWVNDFYVLDDFGNQVAVFGPHGDPYQGETWVFGNAVANAVATVAFSATPVFNLSGGDQFITLTGNVTSSTFSRLFPGQRVTFTICQDATGSRTFVWPTAIHGAMTIGSTASKCSVQQFESPDGTTLYATAAGVTNQ